VTPNLTANRTRPVRAFLLATVGAARRLPITLGPIVVLRQDLIGERIALRANWSKLVVNFDIECEREDDGRSQAEVPEWPGVVDCGTTGDEAMATAQILALRVRAERLEHGESRPQSSSISVAAA
jgi:predicted RNase H-like HicB family nuclease